MSTLGNTMERNRRILVIDDNPAIHADFRKILASDTGKADELARAEAQLFGRLTSPASRAAAFEVEVAFQGRDGLALVQQAMQQRRPFAMAFVDVRMPPGWDGVETTTRLWETDPDLQIVICTAYSDYSWEEMTARLGTSDRMVILKKPFDAVEVLQLANTLTEKWTLLQQSKLKLQDLERLILERTREIESANQQLRLEVRERELTEQVLRSTQEKLNHFLAKSPAVLYSSRIDGDRTVPVWVSENFKNFTGREIAEWFASGELACVEEVDRALVRDGLNALRLQNHLSLQYRVRRKDSVIRWVRDDQQLLRDEQGRPVEIVGCWTDITEQRLLEAELRQSQKMESVGLLAGGIAHDFNNLLTVIRCQVELLLGTEAFSGPTTDALRQVLAAADRAGNLTRQLLAFGRKQIMRSEHLDLNDVISNLARLLARTLGEHISLQVDCAPNLPAVLADRGMIEQVVMNLAVNARDAMPKGGRLAIATSVEQIDDAYVQEHREARGGTNVCLTVTDVGTGIAPELLNRIFEPFFTTKEVGKGTGLGLATVYGIVKQHDGWVEVQSRVGQGTAFKVFLPVSTSRADSTKPEDVSTPTQRGTETVLVVEDEPALRNLVRGTLQKQGYQVFTAGSGVEALNAWSARLHQIDLLLTDLVMPDGLTGWELARRLHAQRPALKVIFMTGYSAEMQQQQPAERSKFRILHKPFGHRALADAVRATLDEPGHQPETV
jgi:two-component system, cell cycle sensor histidine kinase and response regulator CckA